MANLEAIIRDMNPRARQELLANSKLQAQLLAIYKQHSDRRGGRGIVRLLPKKSRSATCCPH